MPQGYHVVPNMVIIALVPFKLLCGQTDGDATLSLNFNGMANQVNSLYYYIIQFLFTAQVKKTIIFASDSALMLTICALQMFVLLLLLCGPPP